MTLKETGYELYNDGVSASLIHNDYNNYDEEEENGIGKQMTTVPHRTAPTAPTQNGNGAMISNRNGRNGTTQIEEEEEDPKIINQKPIEIGPSNV